MPTSQLKIESNRRNAQKSTGPRTTAGKNRSRFNALKHGEYAKTWNKLLARRFGVGFLENDEIGWNPVSGRATPLPGDRRPSSSAKGVRIKRLPWPDESY